jgi:uncharacterized protein YndB with AHSA1/START domain
MTRPSESRAPARRETHFSTPTACELLMTRTFDAPRALVWAAFTDPRHVPNWQTGPDGFTMPVCEIDLRPGGRWYYLWRNAQGREFSATGTYGDVEPPTRFVQLTIVNGEANTSTTTFAEEEGRTTVTVLSRFASEASREQAAKYARMGAATNYVRLDGYLASTQQALSASE